jgi:transposase
MTTQLEIELSALRARRRSPGLAAWLRRLRPFDRRTIRDPDSRDEYWVRLQRRLAESDAASLMRYSSTNRPARPHLLDG